jgi:hypothetical protein
MKFIYWQAFEFSKDVEGCKKRRDDPEAIAGAQQSYGSNTASIRR